MIRDENAMLTGYVYLDLDGRDPQDYVAEAAGVLARETEPARGIHAARGAASMKRSSASTSVS